MIFLPMTFSAHMRITQIKTTLNDTHSNPVIGANSAKGKYLLGGICSSRASLVSREDLTEKKNSMVRELCEGHVPGHVLCSEDCFRGSLLLHFRWPMLFQ